MNALDLLKSLQNGISMVVENFKFFQASSGWNLFIILILETAQALSSQKDKNNKEISTWAGLEEFEVFYNPEETML